MAKRIIDDAIQALYDADIARKEANEKYEKARRAIIEYMDEKNIKVYDANVRCETADTVSKSRVKVTLSKSMTISYDIEALREKLDEELFSEIVIKQYALSDVELLKKYFKKAGFTPKDFKKCVASFEIVDNAKMQQLYSLGDINLKMIKGCYEAKTIPRLRQEIIK